MKIKLLGKDRLENLLQDISGDYTVFVPHRQNRYVTFREFKRKEFLLFPYANYDVSAAKCFFFPSSIIKHSKYDFDDSWMKPGKKVLFGVRPCDAHSLMLLDKTVTDNDAYRKKREDILLIVQGCNAPRSTCFCTSVHGGPFSAYGADVFITDIGDDFLLEDISGRAAGYLAHLSDAGDQELKKKERVSLRSDEMIEVQLDFHNFPERLEQMQEKLEREGIWQKLGETCTNCTQCTDVCPTCHCCFLVEDVKEMVCDELGDRARDFDPCMLNIILSSGFSDTAPRSYNRLKRRLLDKFCDSVKTVGQPYCTGCGRCVISCEENIDIIEILKLLTESDITDRNTTQYH